MRHFHNLRNPSSFCVIQPVEDVSRVGMFLGWEKVYLHTSHDRIWQSIIPRLSYPLIFIACSIEFCPKRSSPHLGRGEVTSLSSSGGCYMCLCEDCVCVCQVGGGGKCNMSGTRSTGVIWCDKWYDKHTIFGIINSGLKLVIVKWNHSYLF